MKPLLSNTIIQAIQKVVPENSIPVNLHEPLFSGNELNYVKDTIDSSFVSSTGKYVDKFENMLAEYTGIKKAVAVVNGTAALQICLQLAGVEAEDEVLIPALTFVATANAVTYCKAVPHFVDSEGYTLGLDPVRLKDYLNDIAVIRSNQCYNKMTGRRIKAVMPMHTFGHPVDLDPLIAVCERFSLTLIEDAAESLGSFYKGRHTGSFGRLSALSFNGNKIITTGGGGAILTNDLELGKLAKHITTTAKAPHRWDYYHDQVGYNYRLPNINAALGCAQMEQLPSCLGNKRKLALSYEDVFSQVEGLRFFVEPEFASSNYWLNALLLDEQYAGERDNILEATNNAGIMTRPAWKLMSKLPMFKDYPKMNLDVAESLEARIINIPSSAFLATEKGCAIDG